MFSNKIAVLPCTGIGQVVGTISREAAYCLCDRKRPDDTVLVCLPALVKGVQEDIDMIRRCPVIVIEGCKEHCASYALKTQGGRAAVTIFIPDAISKENLTIKNSNRACLTDTEQTIAERVAQNAAEAIDRLKAGGGE